MTKKCKCKNKKVANKFYGGGWAKIFNTMGNDPAQYKDGVATNVDKYGLTQGGHNAINTSSMALNAGLKAAAGQNQNVVGNAFTTMGGLMGNFPGWIGWIGKAAEAVGHGINATIGYNVNKENIQNIKNNINTVGDFQGNTSDINSLYNSILNAPTLMNWEHSDLGTQGLLSTKIDNIDNSLHQKAENALNRQQRNIYDAQQNVALNTLNNLESGSYAYGGPFNMKYTGVMSPFGNQFDDGGPLEELVKLVNSKDVNFVRRLKDPNRKHIKDWESDAIATHKLGVSTDELGNNYIYPEVQEINGKLIDFTRPPYHPFAGQLSAEEKGDTVRVNSIEDGLLFTENYKKFYPKGKTFAEGGFTNGVTQINNGGTHEYLEGQEYDVTEDEIKLLKKLGYEFEYL